MMNCVKIMTVVAILILPWKLCHGDDLSAKRETARLTAELLVAKIDEGLKTRSIGVNPIYNDMNSNMEKHVNLNESRNISAGIAENSLREWRNAEVKRILDKLDADKPENIPSWFTGEERLKLMRCPEDAVKKNLEGNLGAAFNEARKRACSEQLGRLIGDVYPTEQEFDSTPADKLRSMLLERLMKKQKEPVFEENKGVLGENFIDPILNDAGKQLAKQNQIVDQSSGGKAVVSEDVRVAIESELADY